MQIRGACTEYRRYCRSERPHAPSPLPELWRKPSPRPQLHILQRGIECSVREERVRSPRQGLTELKLMPSDPLCCFAFSPTSAVNDCCFDYALARHDGLAALESPLLPPMPLRLTSTRPLSQLHVCSAPFLLLTAARPSCKTFRKILRPGRRSLAFPFGFAVRNVVSRSTRLPARRRSGCTSSCVPLRRRAPSAVRPNCPWVHLGPCTRRRTDGSQGSGV